MSAETTKLSHIQDEDVLRKMWQDTEDFGKKKEIRSHMYKLREQRLREFYNGSEMTESRTSKTTGKVTQSSTHADSLVDQSFQSFKSKEVRDSGSPTRDIHYKVPDSNEWQVASNNEVSRDGKTRIHSTVASVQGTQKIDGGQIDFQGKNEKMSSVYHNADENAVTTRSQTSSKSSSSSRMVASNTVPSEQFEVPSNQGVTKVIRETKTLPDGSTVTTTRYDTTSGSTQMTSQSGHVQTSQTSSSRQVNDQRSENIVSLNNQEIALPSSVQGVTKITRESKNLPDGSTVICTRYNTTSDNTQSGHIETAKHSSKTHITSEKESTLKTSSQNIDNANIKIIKETKIIPETSSVTSVTNRVSEVKEYVQNQPQIPSNLQGVTKVTKETKTLPDGSIMTTTKYHTVSGTTTHTEVLGSGKISKEHSSVTNKSIKRVDESVDNQQNYKTEKTHSVNNKVTDDKDIIRSTFTSTLVDNKKNVTDNSTKVINVNENVNVTTINTDDGEMHKITKVVTTKPPLEPKVSENTIINQQNKREEFTDKFINTERKQEVLTRNQYPDETPKTKPSSHRDISPTKPTKSDYQPSKPTDGQYETTYRSDYTNRKISVEVSPTHDAFARSLRAVSPDRVSSRGSHRTSNSSLPEKMRHPSRISPERTHRNRGGSPTKSSDRFSSTDTYIYNKRKPTDEEPKTKSTSPKRYGNTDTFKKTESQETITISNVSRHNVVNTTNKRKDVTRSQQSLPRSRSPSPTKPFNRRQEVYEIVTDLDEDITVLTEKQTSSSRPTSLELSKKTRKVTDRSPSYPLSDIGSSQKSPTKDLRRTSSFKSPTKDRSPTKGSKDNLPKSPIKEPTGNLLEDRPLKRTDTYEERCRQILGITEVTDKRKSSLERSSSKRSSFRRNTSSNNVDTTESTSPTKEKPRSPTKSPVKERPRSRDFDTTDTVLVTKTVETRKSVSPTKEKPRGSAKSPTKEKPTFRDNEIIDIVSTTRREDTTEIIRSTEGKPRSPVKDIPLSRDNQTTDIVTTRKTKNTTEIVSPTKERPRSPTKSPVKERPLSKGYETTDIVSVTETVEASETTRSTTEKPRSPTKHPDKRRPLSTDYEGTDIVTVTKIKDTSEIASSTKERPKSPTKSPKQERPLSREYETNDTVLITETVDTSEIVRSTEKTPKSAIKSPLKGRPLSRDYDTTDIILVTETVDTTEISRSTDEKPRSPTKNPDKENPLSRDNETIDTVSMTERVDVTEITRPNEKKPKSSLKSPLKDKPLSRYDTTDIVTTTKSSVKELPTSSDYETTDTTVTKTTKDTTEIIRPAEKSKSPIREKPLYKGYETESITTTKKKETTTINERNEQEKVLQTNVKKPGVDKNTPDKGEPNKYPGQEQTIDINKFTELVDIFNKEEITVYDDEYKTPRKEATKPVQNKPENVHQQMMVDHTDKTSSKTSLENISRKDIKNVTEDITEQEVEIVARKPFSNKEVDESPRKGPSITEFPSQKKLPQDQKPTNLTQSKNTIQRQVDERFSEETTIYGNKKPSDKAPSRPKSTTDKHKTTTKEFIMQEKFNTEINSSTEALIDETEIKTTSKKQRKVTDTRVQSIPTDILTIHSDNITDVEEIFDTKTSEQKPLKPKITDDKPKKNELGEYPSQSKSKPKDVSIKNTSEKVNPKEIRTKPGETKEPTSEFSSRVGKQTKVTSKTISSTTEDVYVEDIMKKPRQSSPENKKPTKQGLGTHEKPVKPVSTNETEKISQKDNNVKTLKNTLTDKEETIIDELIVVDDSDVPQITIGKPIPKEEKPKKVPKQHAIDQTKDDTEDDVDFIQEVIVTDEFEIVNIPKQGPISNNNKPKQKIPQYPSQAKKPITKNISKENIIPTKEKPKSKLKKPTTKEPIATEKHFEPINYENMIAVEEPLMIKKHIDTSCPDEIRHAEKITKKNIEKEQKKLTENASMQKKTVKPEKESPVHKTQISTTSKKPQKQPEKPSEKPVTRKIVHGITEYQDQYNVNVKPKSVPRKPKNMENTSVFKPSSKINTIPPKSSTKVLVNGFHKPEKPKTIQETTKTSTVQVSTARVPKQPNMDTVTRKTTKTINLKENEPTQHKLKNLPTKSPIRSLTKPSQPDDTTKKHLVTTTITLKSNTQPITLKQKVSKTTTTVTKSDRNRITDLKQKRVNEYVSTDTDEDETLVETVDVSRRNGTKRQPEKCITTKTVIINNNTQPRQIVVDLQRSKSSREPTPDKICPVPTEYGGYGSPRYPDEIEEPDEVNIRKPSKRLSDIPVIESEEVTNFSRITEIADTKVVTDIDKVENTDESLLSVNKKINLFLDTADKLTKGSKTPSGPAPKVERPKLEVTEDLKSDECLLSVSQKVTKFINTADQFMNVRDLPERPKSPRCKFNNDKISSNNFITTEQKTIQKENINIETGKVSLENLNSVDIQKKSAPTDIKKEPKSVDSTEKPGTKKPSDSPNDEKYSTYNTITKRISLENLEVQSTAKTTDVTLRNRPERVSPIGKRPLEKDTSPDDTRCKPNERSSPDRSPSIKTSSKQPETPNRRPPNEYSSIKSIKSHDIKSTTKDTTTTPKSSKDKPVEDKRTILSNTGRLRSTESIKKARAIFENINKESEKVNIKSPICVKKETVVKKLSYSSDDDLTQTVITKHRSNSPNKSSDVPHYMLPLDRNNKTDISETVSPDIEGVKPHLPDSHPGNNGIPHYMLPLDRPNKSESLEINTTRTRSPGGVESGNIPHYMLPLDKPKSHIPRSKSPDRERSHSPNFGQNTGEIPHYMLPLDRSQTPNEPDNTPHQHVPKSEHGESPHYMSSLHRLKTHTPRSKSPDTDSLRSCSPNVKHYTGEIPHYMLPLDRNHTTTETELQRYNSHVTKIGPGDTPHYMSPLHKPTTHNPRSKSPDRESLRSCSPNVRHETGEIPHYMLPLDRNHTANEPYIDEPRHKEHPTKVEPGVTPHYMSPLHRPKIHSPRSKSPDRESLRSSSPNRYDIGEIPHYMLPLDKRHLHSSPEHKSPDRDTPRHKSPETKTEHGDIPHYMLPLDRDTRVSRPRSKSPCEDNQRHTSPDVRSESSDVPHYMLPLDRNVHIKDNLTTSSKPDTPNKFGVTLKKVHPNKPVTVPKTTSTKVSIERKPSNVDNITEEEIENIFEVEILEEMLQRITSYELRRVIRTQIRLIKKLITENRLTIYIQERQQSRINKEHSEVHTEHFSSYSETRKSSIDRTTTGTRSPQRTPSPTKQPKSPSYITKERVNSEEIHTRSLQRTPSPTKPFSDGTLTKTTHTTIRTSTPREIVRKPGERSSPERVSKVEQTPQRQTSPSRTKTTVQSSYTLSSSSDVPTTKQINRKTLSPERVSLVETTSKTEQVRRTSTEKSSFYTKTTSPERSTPEKKEPRHPSPEKKVPKNGYSILKKTEIQQKKVEEKKPEWITNRNLKKVTASTTNEKVRTTSKKTVKEEKIVTSNEYQQPTDLITSSYGVGPTDENGTPLFGLKALRQTNNGTTKVQGTFIQSQYYSENGQEPVGQITVTNYSTDPRDLSTDEQIQNNNLVTSVTTTQKFGYEDSPSLDTLTNKHTIKQIEDSVAESNRTSNFKRQNSVKAISQKFIDSAVESLKNERQTSYPKAGLILRTSSFKDSKNTSNEDDISPDVVTSTKTSKHITKTSTSGGSFLSNKSTISGVTDVINRMKTEDYEEGDSSEDIEAKSLLNKFIGSQVILSGMENMGTSITTSKTSMSELVPTTTTKKTIKLTTTVTEGGKTKTKTLVFQSPITEEELENIWDEKILRLLLEQSTEYEERRIIRNRLRSVMAEQEACADLVQKASQEQSSGKIEESVTVEKSSSETPTTTTTTKVTKISTQQQVTKKPLSPFAKFQQLDKQNTPPGTPGTPKTPGNGPLFKFTDPALSLSAATIKDRLLYWCRMKTKEYENVQLDNFSTSWADGLAFCALIHHFLPDAFDYHALTPKERRHNFELAFKVASDKADIFPLLDVDDMMATRRPDWKCVFTYVQSIYRRFKDEEI